MQKSIFYIRIPRTRLPHHRKTQWETHTLSLPQTLCVNLWCGVRGKAQRSRWFGDARSRGTWHHRTANACLTKRVNQDNWDYRHGDGHTRNARPWRLLSLCRLRTIPGNEIRDINLDITTKKILRVHHLLCGIRDIDLPIDAVFCSTKKPPVRWAQLKSHSLGRADWIRTSVFGFAIRCITRLCYGASKKMKETELSIPFERDAGLEPNWTIGRPTVQTISPFGALYQLS